jgi:Lon protease-like protein
VPEKQALLEAPSPAERARTLIALLQMGAHDLDPADLPAGRRLS